MGADTNELDTRDEDKARTEGRLMSDYVAICPHCGKKYHIPCYRYRPRRSLIEGSFRTGGIMKILKKVENKLLKAKQEMKDKLKEKFPEGTIQFFYIQRNQRQPSQGLVVGHGVDGYVRMRLNRSVKNIYFDKIII